MHRHHCLYCQTQALQAQTVDAESLPNGKLTRLGITFLLASLYSGFELLMGQASHSLTLLADAGHMVSDSFGLAIALGAAWWAQRSQLNRSVLQNASPQSQQSQGQPFEIYAALVNSGGLIVMAGWIAWETLGRLQAGNPEVYSTPMILAAVIGLLVHGINAALLYGHSRLDLNLRGAFLHVLADAIGSVGILLAAIAVAQFQWVWADGLIGLLASGLIALSAIPLMADSLKALRWQHSRRLMTQLTQSGNVNSAAPWDVANFSQQLLPQPESVADELTQSDLGN